MASALPGGYAPGTLVLVSGLKDKAKGDDGTTLDLNGTKAQLIEWQADLDLWLAATFGGQIIGIGKQYLKPLKVGDLGSLDHVLGPKSDPKGLAQAMSDTLAEKGYLCMHVILADSYREEICEEFKSLDDQGKLSRLPKGFEHGHLGEGGKGKVLQLKGTTAEGIPDSMKATQLGKQDQNISMMCDLMTPFLKKNFGIGIQGRTPLMLRLPFADLDDEAKYLPTTATSAEADQFLELMGRRQLGVVQFMGPASGSMTLLPRIAGLPEVKLDATPGTMVLWLAERYNHKVEDSGENLTLASWFLEPVHNYTVVTSVSGTSTSTGDLAIFGKGAPIKDGPQIKVTGISSRDPCNLNYEDHFWYALRHGGCDGFLPIPTTRFDTDLYMNWRDMQQAQMEGKTYCRHQGHIEGIDYFDAEFFNIPKNEVWSMDPEQRFVCEAGWSALQSAGFDNSKLRKDSAHLGTYIGISASDWTAVVNGISEVTGMMVLGNGVPETFIANRFSFIMNLKGPSFVCNTACSASLTALNAAKQNLLSPYDPLDGGVIGGISLNTAPGTWIANCAAGMLSFKGRSFSFMDGADGYGRGEGCACGVIQKGKQSDENAFALLAATHTNSCGRSASLTAPNGPAQQRLLKAVLEETKRSITEISLYEAHGTGTMLGDPIELGAVQKVLARGRENGLIVSCSKTNMGHLEGGAGMSGFIKCVQSVMHTEAVPNQHVNLLNPNLQEGFPLQVISEGLHFGLENVYVGVSGFGYGGTNSHGMAYGKKLDHLKKSDEGGETKTDRVFKRIFSAPPPTVTMDSANYEEWRTTGIPHLTAKDGDRFHVQVQKGGEVIWRRMVEPDLPAEETSPFIQGSFNDGCADILDASEDVEGLFSYDITLGPSGEETFSFMLDADPDLAFFPEELSCSKKTSRIVGPQVPPSPDNTWVIRGKPDETYRVELYLAGAAKTINWFRIED